MQSTGLRSERGRFARLPAASRRSIDNPPGAIRDSASTTGRHGKRPATEELVEPSTKQVREASQVLAVPAPQSTLREHASLDARDVLHHTDEQRPSGATRNRLIFSPAPELPADHIVECTRHHLLGALACAFADRSRPFLIHLSYGATEATALLHAWECHVCAGDRSYKAAAPCIEGVHRTLRQAWAGAGLCIQHDLDEDVCTHNPVFDFLRLHPHLLESCTWARVEAWVGVHVGRIARRPAFINGSEVRPTTTHYDDYESVALVLAGAKTFYLAPPHLVHQTGCGMLHESSAHPHRVGTRREQAAPQPFLRAEVPAGSVLYLPRGWWHFVESRPKTIMLCAWV